MELMLNESMDRSLMAKASSWDQDERDDEGCMSAEISFSSLLATDLEMLDSLKNEHRQGGSGKKTIAKEKKKRERQQQQQHQQKSQQKQQQPQINSHRKKPSIYQASMDFLASYHGPTHTGQGEYSTRYLKKAAEQGKHPADWSAIERFTPDLPSKNDTSGSRSRFASVASANSSTTLLLHTDDDGAILLVSTRPIPTQFYSALKTRRSLRTLVTNNEQEFENMLERGFIWSPVSELVDPNNPDDDEVLEDQDQDFMIPSVPPQYFMTLRITLTPWHARADESEIYGHFARKQAPIPTITKTPSACSLNSSISPSLSPAASATSLSLESSMSSDSGPSAPSTPPPKDGSPESECPFTKAIRTAPVILERSSSLLRSRKQIDRSPHASPKLTGRTLKASPPSSIIFCEKPEGLTKYQMDYRDSSNYNLVAPASPTPMSPHHHFWPSKREPSGDSDSLAPDQVLDCHHARYDNHRLAQIPRYQVNESRGLSIVPRSVHRDVAKVDRGFVITNNSRSNRSSAQDECGSKVTDVVTPASGFETTRTENAAVAAQESGCWRPVQLCQTPVMQTFAFP
ncbi:hypothetical protein BGZ74_010881 [Mortierella antarctica]|nr:hypothetical protein BGZ74_010881 [Mortierella antarctica]